jgi:2-polyprenyl-3-methyl-5-hydroxy-6-metoxy-1,4-benzoquinol methylase
METDRFLELNAGHPQLGKFRVHYDEKCIVCHSPAPSQWIGNVTEHEYTNTVSLAFPVYRCETCRLVYLYPRPDVSELGTIYPGNYYSYNLSVNKAEATFQEKSLVKSIWFKLNQKGYRRRILPFVDAHPTGRPLRILEVGCGAGSQLDNIRKLLPDAETHGIDINRDALERARGNGHTVYHGRFEEVDIPSGYFDIILSIHVIEHVDRPDLFVQKCLASLSSQGVVLFETPNTDSLDYEWFKRGHWGGYHAPRHWYLFNVETFRHLSKRLNAEIVAHGSYTTSVFWNWSCHSLCKSAFNQELADRLFPPIRIFYGGIQPFFILSFFAIMERVLFGLSHKANSLWVVLRRSENTPG